MANEVDVALSTAHAQSEIEALQQRLNQALATARELAGSLSGGQGGPDARAQFMGSLSEIAGLKGAITGLQASATTGASGGATVASSAARQAVKSFAGWGLGPYAAPDQAIQIAQESGAQIDTSRYAAAGAGNLAASVVRQVQQQQMLSTVSPYAGMVPVGGNVLASVGTGATAGFMNGGVRVPFTYGGGGGFLGGPAGAVQVSGPASFMGSGGAPLSPWWYTQPSGALSGAQRLGLGMSGLAFGAGMVQGISGGLDVSTSLALHGGVDIMGTAGVGGRAFGTVAGAAALSFMGPWGMAAGAMGGGQIFESAARWLAAPYQNATNAMLNALPLATLAGGGAAGTSPQFFDARFNFFAGQANRGRIMWPGTPWETNGPTAMTSVQFGEAFGSLSQGMVAGGMNPFAEAPGRIMVAPGDPDIARAQDAMRRRQGAGALLPGLAGTAIGAIRNAYGTGVENIGEMYTLRLARLYGNLAPDMAKTVAPIFGTLPDTGGNTADILRRFGPEATERFLRIQRNDLVPSVSLEQLEATRALTGEAERRARLGGLQVRGSGAAAEAGYRDVMGTLTTLPGGRDSEYYAETRQRALEAQRTRFQQEDITQFSLRDVQLHGMRDILSVLPYAPGSRMELAGSIIRNDLQEIGRVRNRMTALRQRGELSEEDELRMTSQVWNLRRDYAQEIGQLSEGFMDRIPGMVAGRVQGFGRASSMQQAAFMAGMSGWATRRYGAVTGGQQTAQDAIVGNLVGALAIPTSTTSNFNNGFGAGNQDLGSKLDRIANLLERNLQGPPDQRKRQTKGGINGRELPDDHGRDPDYN